MGVVAGSSTNGDGGIVAPSLSKRPSGVMSTSLLTGNRFFWIATRLIISGELPLPLGVSPCEFRSVGMVEGVYWAVLLNDLRGAIIFKLV